MADISGNQRRVLGEFLAQLRPYWRGEAGLPARIERLIRSDRRFGSRDRKLYRELIYTTLRYLNWIEPWLGTPLAIEAIAWLAAETPATRAFRENVLRSPPSRVSENAGRVSGAAGADMGSDSDPSATSAPAFAATGRPDAGTSLSAGNKSNFPLSWPTCPNNVQAKAAILASYAGTDKLPSLLPDWAAAECPVALIPVEYDALHRRAPLWIRLQGHQPELVLQELSARHWPWRRSEILPTAVRVDAEADLTDTLAYQSGMLEIQDLGSQLILASAQPGPGGRWLDACAGAGGKSLQLAELLGPDGIVEVNDIRPEALLELERRAVRAHLGHRIRRAHSAPGTPMVERDLRARWAGPRTAPDSPALYDGVLVDAPCTGSGTWRRSPHLKATTTTEQIRIAAQLQSQLLAEFSAHVIPGGRLIYSTCSLCARENEQVVEGFLAARRDFAPVPAASPLTGQSAGPGLLFTPSKHDGDGFFVATLRRLP